MMVLESSATLTRNLAWIVAAAGLLGSCAAPTMPDGQQPIVPLHDGWTVEQVGGIERVAAEVPGHVQLDLARAGRVPDAYLNTHENDVQWVEEAKWTYRLAFAKPDGWQPGDTTTIRFAGLDTYAEVWLDGRHVLSADNAHIPWELPPFLAGDSAHTLEVRFDPVAARGWARLQAAEHVLPCSNEPRPIGRQTSPYTRKSNYQFGWDWGPRLAGPGIPGVVEWRNVNQGGGVPPPAPWCEVLDTLGHVRLHETQGWALDSISGTQWERLNKGDALRIVDPQLWWPRGMGEQPIYRLHWRHEDTGARIEQPLGLRTLRWDRTPDEHGPQFALQINGCPVQARGANIIPGDFFIARADAMWAGLVAQAAAANMNMLRVWGGGAYPAESFYAACDRAGILVWQDFMFACAMVPGDADFSDQIRTEATHHIRRLRAHPALALWCGNNEVEKAWQTWGWQDMYDLHGADSAAVEADYTALFDTLLPALVDAHSPTPYWPSSPHQWASGGDEHAWGVWFGFEDFDYYSRHDGRFASEYGLQSLPDLHTLKAAGVSAFADSALQYRQRSRMDWLEPGFDGWDMMRHFMDKTVGAPRPEDLQDWVFRSQATQALGLREALERHRTSNNRIAGSLYWSLNDVWPAVSWSTIDHSGRWKLGHYAARRANAPQTVIWQRERTDSLVFQILNDAPELWRGNLEVQLRDFHGIVKNKRQIPFEVGGRKQHSVTIGPLADWATAPAETALWWQWGHAGDSTENESSSAMWGPPVAAIWPMPLGLQTQASGDTLTVVAEAFCPLVQLTASVPGHFSDNGFAIWPEETIQILFQPEKEPEGGKEITFEAQGVGGLD